MARPAICPPALARCVFRGSEAVAEGLITSNRLRHPMWSRYAEDVYVLGEHRDEPWARREALRLITNDRHVACGLAAAWLHGVWSPPPGTPVPLQVSRPKATNGQQIEGQRRRRLTLVDTLGPGTDATDVVEVDGVLATSPLRTCFDLMRDRQLVEAVVVADAFLHGGAVDPLSLALYCQERGRWPRVRQARLAVGLANAFTRSPGESRLRMVVVLAGFETPMVNVPVLDALGQHLATPDLQIRGRRWVWLEYDGSYHEAVEQHEADVRRENRLAVASAGVPVLRYDRRHVATAAGRRTIVDDVARAGGIVPTADLRPRDFLRPGAGRAW